MEVGSVKVSGGLCEQATVVLMVWLELGREVKSDRDGGAGAGEKI